MIERLKGEWSNIGCRWLVTSVMFVAGILGVTAQTEEVDTTFAVTPDSVLLNYLDTLAKQDTKTLQTPRMTADTLVRRAKRDWSTWQPNPQRALWLALVFPGGGQIYNRKFWKLPLVYGGFVGCVYALTWNNMMYKDYAQAYLDIMDDDPGTASYNKFLHLGRQITPENEARYKTLFKKRKDRYRRYRDMSFFVMVGVYALSVIDAYVDAELSVFDISKDLSMRVSPGVISTPRAMTASPLQTSSVGLNCQINF